MQDSPEDRLNDLIAAARKAGADAAEVGTMRSRSASVTVRLGKLETVQWQEPESWVLRVWVGQRSAAQDSIDLGDRTACESLIERAIAMARLAPEDPYSMLAPAAVVRCVTLADEAPLELYDPAEPTTAELESTARDAEAAALAVAGVTNSSGGEAAASASRAWRINSEGFSSQMERSSFNIGVGVIAGEHATMQIDGFSRKVVWRADLPSPESIGTEAGQRAVARLNPRRVPSTCGPVIFERRIAAMLLSPFLTAIHGSSIARGGSFLRHRRGERVFASNVRILDDPAVVRGAASRLIDTAGVPSRKRLLIEDGVLNDWVLDVSSARQLGLAPNCGDLGNLTLMRGQHSLQELMAEAGTGLLVTSMFRPSLNIDTGDWSAGVSGLWFERGEIAFAANEITVAGSLPDIYARLVPGADLRIEGGFDAPSLLVDGVTIAGA